MACEHVLCGRATWKEGIPVYAKDGVKALEDWLVKDGVKNINAVNDVIKAAKVILEQTRIERARLHAIRAAALTTRLRRADSDAALSSLDR